MTETHDQRLDRLIAAMGGLPVVIERLKVRVSRARVKECLAAGDEYLNRIDLGVWDRLALGVPVIPPDCPTCGQKRPPSYSPFGPDWPGAALRATAKGWPQESKGALLSLADRVCILKRAAVRWAAFEAPDPED